MIDTDGGDGTKSAVLSKWGDTVFKAVFLNFLPEFNAGVVRGGGGGLNWGGFFLRLSQDENKNGAGNRVDGVLFLGDADVGVGSVLD